MRRWVTLSGRGGTVLLAVGLALLLVSLIPSIQMSMFALVETTLYPKRIVIPISGIVLTPQYGLRINVTANGTLNVYILEVSSQTFFSWVEERYPEPIDYQNGTHFEEFLEANPDSIGWQDEVHNGKLEYEHVPTKITNATLVFSNPTLDVINVAYEVSITGLVAPASKVRALAQWTIPVGFVLALPWFIDLLRTKIRQRGLQLSKKPTSNSPVTTEF